jgi:hypothetical protein
MQKMRDVGGDLQTLQSPREAFDLGKKVCRGKRASHEPNLCHVAK